MRNPNYTVNYQTNTRVMITDLGPWDTYPTVTNGAETVIKELHNAGILGVRKLLYVDSDGETSELLHDGNGTFLGFAYP